MIKFLADENFPLESIDLIQSRGYDILSVLRSHRGILDEEVIRIANLEQRLILTFDADFGQLIFKEGKIPNWGICYFRLQKFKASEPAEILEALINKKETELTGMMTVIEENFIRQKKIERIH